MLREVESFIKYGVGVDFKAPLIKTEKLETLPFTLQSGLPFNDRSFDFITMLAVMEHLEDDVAVLRECERLLKPGGGLLITVPSWYAKPILEILSFKLNLLNPDEIRDHKRYYDKSDLVSLFEQIDGLYLQEHAYFQFGFNNRVFARKNG